MSMVKEDIEGHPEYALRDSRLYRHILHTLDFNDIAPGNQWKICVSPGHSKNVGSPVPSVLLARNVEDSCKICPWLP